MIKMLLDCTSVKYKLEKVKEELVKELSEQNYFNSILSKS